MMQHESLRQQCHITPQHEQEATSEAVPANNTFACKKHSNSCGFHTTSAVARMAGNSQELLLIAKQGRPIKLESQQ
jgi:hypothetical protein